MRAEDGHEPPVRVFFGRVAARATVDLAFEVGGRIVSLDAVEGRRVTAATAVVTRGADENFVFVVESEGEVLIARRRPVDVAMPEGDTVRVLGLEDDAEIVTVGGHLLEEGDRVSRYDGLMARAED
ncbi:hypothetical protein V6767_09530 [Martelella sp. FLE1502]